MLKVVEVPEAISLVEDQSDGDMLNIEGLLIILRNFKDGVCDINIRQTNMVALVNENVTGYNEINNQIETDSLRHLGEWLIKQSQK